MSEFLTEKRSYRKKPIVVEAYQTDKEFAIETLEGTMTANVGDFIITGVSGEQYPCKPDIFYRTYDVEDTSIDDPIIDNLTEWSSLITELSGKEVELLKLKDVIFDKEQWIIENTDFKEVYGRNNVDVRKLHLRKHMKGEYENRRALEVSIDFLTRRISFLKQLIHSKTVLAEVKE